MRKATLVISILALVAAAIVGYLAYQWFDALVVSRPIVVAKETIPPYTLVTADMLTVRDLPAPLADEDIYTEAHQVVGKLTTTFIPAGAVIYRPYAVLPAAFRYVDDLTLEVLSFPVDPNKAVGGQVRIGQRVNVWRIVRGQPQGLSATAALSTSLAASELLLPDVLVVDVRSSRGEPVGQPVGESELESQAQRGSQTVPLTILTVALPITETQKLVTLMGEVHLNADVWVSLAAPSTGEEARP
ncbi:MAG: hypothetical protein KKB13_03670 [Chloroflexi bacterium]|nr:hypothetical protein [Chloroflexota bacterium]